MASRAWRSGGYRWQVQPPYDGAEDLARQLGTAPLVAQILHNRGIDDAEAGEAFLNPKLSDLPDPSGLAGAEAAAERIARAVADSERIVIYGDYDVDGITAIAILHAALGMLGADVHYYVPHRLEEGYGVNVKAVRKLLARGMNLMITVDCGISAVGPIAEANAGGADVIITDHHSLPDELPDAAAIVHPNLPPGTYPNADLCGAGVAFKLAWQVARAVRGEKRVDEPMREFLLNATCLAALGTIADIVPLVGENRVLAVFGLRGLPATNHPGLRALLESAKLTGGKLDAYHVGFLLAPRINACGRMGHARLAVEMLTSAAPDRCRQIADYLDKQNVERRKVERAITEEAIEMVAERGLDSADSRAIVLHSENWHGGVIGIVASRLVDKFSRPAVLIAINGDGCGQGSGRSVEGFHMRDALKACGEHLTSFGGHAMAGGLRVQREDIDAFASAFGEYARENITPQQLAPTLRIDAETTLGALSYNVIEHLERLAPFGQGNPSPVVAIRSAEVAVPPRRMGRTGQTVSITLRQGGAAMRAVGFGMGDLADELAGVRRVDVAAQPVLNTFNGRTTTELKLRDVVWE